LRRRWWLDGGIVGRVVGVLDSTLRKEGARSDPYAVFSALVRRGEIADDFGANLRAWQRAHPDQN
jgi:hypothetical protein